MTKANPADDANMRSAVTRRRTQEMVAWGVSIAWELPISYGLLRTPLSGGPPAYYLALALLLLNFIPLVYYTATSERKKEGGHRGAEVRTLAVHMKPPKSEQRRTPRFMRTATAPKTRSVGLSVASLRPKNGQVPLNRPKVAPMPTDPQGESVRDGAKSPRWVGGFLSADVPRSRRHVKIRVWGSLSPI